jgi:hypothetical protein
VNALGERNEKQSRPKATVIEINKPNYELMAKAYLNLYYNGRLKDEITTDEKRHGNEKEQT